MRIIEALKAVQYSYLYEQDQYCRMLYSMYGACGTVLVRYS